MSKQRLATNKQKILLEMATSGKCEICGKPAKEAHHIKQFSHGGETVLANMQYLCVACHKKQHGKKEFTPRHGQKDTWKKVPISSEKFDLIVLPTGYGKTLAALGAFEELYNRGIINRVLITVPSKIQQDQWIDSIKELKENKKFGLINCKFSRCENMPWLARECQIHHKDPYPHLYVALYQLIAQNNGIYNDLTARGKWFIVCDEAHHLAGKIDDMIDGNVWSRFLDTIKFEKAIYLSATPHRNDKVPLKGIIYDVEDDGKIQAKPLVNITRKQAFKEQAIRKPIGHIQHYFVDVDTDDGPIRITTELLKNLGYKDFADFEKAKRGLRYNGKYLSRIILDAINMLTERNSQHPGQHQLLVFCMTCLHAKFVSKTINELVGDDSFSDWIGVSDGEVKRDEEENQKILKKYLKQKLPCLVQVRKANEGFNSLTSSVLLFLNLTKSIPAIEQEIGRGLRRNEKIDDYSEDVCHIFCSADTNLASVIELLENDFLEAFKQKRKRNGGGGGGTPDITEVIDAEFYKEDEIYLPSHIIIPEAMKETIESLYKASSIVPELTRYSSMSHEEIYLFLTGKTQHIDYDKPKSEDEIRKDLKGEADAIRKNIARLFYEKYLRISSAFNSQEYLSIKKQLTDFFYPTLNSRCKYYGCEGNGVSDNGPDGLKKMISWLREVENSMKKGDVPTWLQPQWLQPQ